MTPAITRREALVFAAAAAAGLAMKSRDVRLGVGTYSFRGLTLGEIIRIASAAGVTGLELDAAYLPPDTTREALKTWRAKFHDAGIAIYAYSTNVTEKFSDADIDAALNMTHALGARIFNTAVPMPIARRLVPFAARHKMRIGLHPSGESIRSGASYDEALALSPYLCANLDLYLCRYWGPDPVAFVKRIHTRISTLHFHDRKGQTWAPFGEGDLPTKELLLLAKQEHYDFPFTIERIYNVPDIDHVAEIRRCLDYCRRILTA